MEKNTERCVLCHLPGNYPGSSLNSEKKCTFCQIKEDPSRQKIIHYKGVPALLDKVTEVKSKYPDSNSEYDGILGYSGGIDSTYLLYLLTQVLHLKILAVSMTHRYIPPETTENIKRATVRLGVQCEFIHNPYLDKWADHFIRSWSHKPTAPSLINFCTGCRYGLTRLLPQIARKHNIHIMFTGENYFEATTFKRDIVCLNPDHPTTAGFLFGYGLEVLKNIHYFKSPAGLLFQVKEFLAHRSFQQYLRKNEITHITPFSTYIEWKQADVNKALDALGWKKSIAAAPAWRSDCFINFIRQYYYKKLLGFNDNDFKTSALIRSGETVPEQKTDEKEQNEIARTILKDCFNLDFDAIDKKITGAR